jgi:hypothetical protein
MINCEVEVGDWISFMRDNRLMIGVVHYIQKTSDMFEFKYITSAGCTNTYLEVRRAPLAI